MNRNAAVIWMLVLLAASLSGVFVGVFDSAYFAPIVAAGAATGLIVRRWIVLVVPAVLWLGYAPPAIILWLVTGSGNPAVMFDLIGLYIPIPFAAALVCGVALGRLAWPPGRGLSGGAYATRISPPAQ